MTMLEIHKQALDDVAEVYHEFLLIYKSNVKCVYGFVEGITDPSFFESKIQNELPDGWRVELLSAGTKSKVIKVYTSFDWTRFDKKQILFFMDQDFDRYLSNNFPQSNNIYLTDYYSIENSLVSEDVCKQVLRDLKKLNGLSRKEMDKILVLFNAELRKFHTRNFLISAHLIAWHENGSKPCAENIRMKDLFEFKNGKLINKVRPDNTTGIPAYLCKRLRLHRRGLGPYLKQAENKLQAEHEPKCYVRGKFELWFLVEFCKQIHDDICNYSTKIKERPKAVCDIGMKNAIAIIGPRVQIPKSLKSFLHNTAVVFATQSIDT